VGTESIASADRRSAIAEFCREIETYLCRKNDGHLIRVTGPSFDLVAGWAAQGVPFKVACEGIDRYFERYYRKGPRRRPVKIDFCEADVLDVFDEWRRAVGLPSSQESAVVSPESPVPGSQTHRESLPAHLERAVLRLTEARAKGTLGEAFDALIDRVAAELDAARAKAGGVRGEARLALVARLATLDADLLQHARAALDGATLVRLAQDAEVSLAPFRAGMAPEAFARAREGAIDALVREHCKLPRIAFDHS
jgi:hypothetical protein